MALIFEDENKTLGKKQLKVPDEVVKKLKVTRNLFDKYSKSKGFKRINAILDDDYNKRSKKKDKIHNGDKTISGSDAKKIAFEKEHGEISNNPNDLNNIFTKPLFPWLNDAIRSARTSVKKVKAVPPVPKLEKKPTDIEDVNKPIKMGNASIKITENIDYFYDNYYFDYGVNYVFDSFLQNPKGKQNWGVLINPEMYAKALKEFTRFGKLTSFPSKYVYQWMGIIMKNTSILIANTDICGHSQNFPTEECEEFLHRYFKDGRYITVYDYDKIVLEVTPEEVAKMAKNGYLINEVVDKYGQTYFPWVTQKEADTLANRREIEEFNKTNADLINYINIYNEKNKSEYTNNELNLENGKIYWTVGSDELLYQIGITGDWMTLPDGTDAISDYGIEPIINILNEYDENLPPEKVLVLVNKILDVYHCRGDLSSIFVQGGSKSLSAISEEIKHTKKIIISESQLLVLKEYHDQQVFNFDDNGNAYFRKNNWEHYIDYLEEIGTYGILPASNWDKYDVSNAIENAKEQITPNMGGTNDFDEDDYLEAFYDVVCKSFIYDENKEDLFEDYFLELFNDYESFKKDNNYYNECDTIRHFLNQKNIDSYELESYLTDLGKEEYEKAIKELFIESFENNDVEGSFKYNERGLIYVERNIRIPDFNSPEFEQDYYDEKYKNYFAYLTKIYGGKGYGGIGNCFSWEEDRGEAYCADRFGAMDSTEIKLKCWVDPKDINWVETVYRNCYTLRDEEEVFINSNDAKIEVFDVVLEDGKINGVSMRGKSLLKKPIIVSP